jgi:replicative DNA helicase
LDWKFLKNGGVAMNEFVSLEAEGSLLGAVISDAPRVLPIAVGSYRLLPDSFADVAHRLVFVAMLEMESKSQLHGLDLLTLSQWMQRTGALDKVGGQLFLEGLVDGMPTSAHAEYYADIVRQKWVLRRAVDEMKLAAVEAREAENGEAFARSLPDRFTRLVDERVTEETNLELMQAQIGRWEEAAAGGAPAIGFPFPWDKVTELTCGIEDGMTIIAGRPSAGKSTLEDELSTYLARQGVAVARVQLDMNRKKSLARAVCRTAGVSMPKLKHGYARRDQIAKAKEAAAEIGELPMYINDRDYSLRAICSWARMMKLKHDVKILTVDHIQLVQVDAGLSRGANDNAKVSMVSSTLKALSAELDVKLIVLSQLSRGFDKEARRPRLSDLRDSGTLEQDAAKVLFVYPEYRAKLLAELETEARRPVWFDLVKNQDGETGMLPMWLWKKYFRFEGCPASDHEEQVRMMGQEKDPDVE